MKSFPKKLGEWEVLAWSSIDERHEPTGNCSHINLSTNTMDPQSKYLCICVDESGYYLVHLSEDLTYITDTVHEDEEEALFQAEFEYKNISSTLERM